MQTERSPHAGSLVGVLAWLRAGWGPAFSFVGRISGVLVSVLIVRFVGAGPDTTSIFLALALATFAINSAASVLELQAIAALSRREQNRSDLLIGGTVTGIGMALILACGLVILSPLNGTVAALETPALILLPTIPMSCFYFTCLGIDVFDGRWARPAWAAAARTVVVAIALSLSLPKWGTAGVAPSMLLAEAVRIGSLFPLRYPGGRFATRRVRRFISRVLVQLPSTMFGGANPFADRYVTNALRLGSVAILDLAEKSQGFVTLVLTQGLLPVLYRRWSHQNPQQQQHQMLLTALFGVIGGSVFALVGAAVIFAATPLVLGGHAAEYVHIMRLTSAVYLIGIPAYIGAQVLVRMLILQDRLLAWFNVIAFAQLVVNIGLDILLGSAFGLTGVAAASAAVAWLALLSYAFLTRSAWAQLRRPRVAL